MKVIVVGGGWSGCSAAISAQKQGAEVLLFERTDMLLGTGLVGGIMRNNGRFTAAEEMIDKGGAFRAHRPELASPEHRVSRPSPCLAVQCGNHGTAGETAPPPKGNPYPSLFPG